MVSSGHCNEIVVGGLFVYSSNPQGTRSAPEVVSSSPPTAARLRQQPRRCRRHAGRDRRAAGTSGDEFLTGLPAPGSGPTASRTSLQTDLLAAHERAARLSSHIQRLERRLSEAFGGNFWRNTGLGAPQDLDELQQRITPLEQQALNLRLQLKEKDQDLAAARAANQELMTRLNTAPLPSIEGTCTTPVAHVSRCSPAQTPDTEYPKTYRPLEKCLDSQIGYPTPAEHQTNYENEYRVKTPTGVPLKH